nr:O-antigen ligase family protein [Herbiconiux flava]
MIFVVVLALPVTRSVDAIARRLAILTIIVCLIPVGLSVSRTNFVVMAMVLVLWALLLPRSSKLGGRLAILGIVGVVGFLFLDQFIVRLTEDPAGGARDHLAAVALKHIPDNLLIGVGPGNYIPYFGQFDALTGSGWPVHNMFLLALAELGLAGAVLLFFPSIVFSVRAIPAFRRTDERGSYSRALVLMTLAVSVVGLTSWGMLGGSLLYLWFFTLGYLARRAFGKADTSNPEVITTSAVLRTRDHLAR